MHAETVVGRPAIPGGRQRRSTDPVRFGLFEVDPAVRRLTARERTVALLIAQEHTDYVIAERLEISVGTVKNYCQRIQRRLQLTSRAEIVAWVTARTFAADPDQLRRVGD